jgi:ribosomal protein S18 acetylase RimI-like enzyme
MTKALHFRPLEEDDVHAYRALRLHAIADSPTSIWQTHAEQEARPEADLRAALRQTPNQVVYGAFDGGELVAIAGLRREVLQKTRHKAMVWGVFVAPGYRKLGVARELLAHLRQFAQREGVLQIVLSVNAENVKARALYASLGFTVFGREPRALQVDGLFYDEEHMVLPLDGQSRAAGGTL